MKFGLSCVFSAVWIWASSHDTWGASASGTPGDTTSLMLNQMAKFATDDTSATYSSATSTTFEDLFVCSQGDQAFLESQDAAWTGFVVYSDYANVTGDTWGNTTTGYLECGPSCLPEMLQFPLEDGQTIQDLPIYEPCNFVSNLAYYRVMPQLCGSSVFMDPASTSALVHAYATLGWGSSFMHGSRTSLGREADNILIAVIAFLIHQVIVDGLAQANAGSTIAGLTELKDLSSQPRPKTAVESMEDIINFLRNGNVTEWEQGLIDLGMPDYYDTFTVIITTVITVIFPDRPDTVESIVVGLSNLFGSDPNTATRYLPAIRDLSNDLLLTEEEKFVVFRQLAAVGGKMVFAFFWQEQVFPFEYFLDEDVNQVGEQIMEPLFAVFNFISGFEFVDETFQTFEGMYPGEDSCRPTVPHAKWHELSANGLLDMTYMADCVAAVAAGQASTACAQLSTIDGLGEITLADFEAFIAAKLTVPDSIVKDALPRFFIHIFDLFDTNDDNTIEWNDVETYINTLEDGAQAVQDFVQALEDLMSLFDTFNCITDSQCSGGEQCTFLSCGLQADGEPCVWASQCESGRCEWGSFTCQAKLPTGAACDEDSDCSINVCNGGLGFIKGTCGLQANGGTCLVGPDCESGRCEGIIPPWTCAPKLSDGQSCNEASDCLSNACIYGSCGYQEDGDPCAFNSDCASGLTCELFGLSLECTSLVPNGQFCNEDSDCISGSCEGVFSWACEPRRGRGSSCNEDSDCISLRCECEGFLCSKGWRCQ